MPWAQQASLSITNPPKEHPSIGSLTFDHLAVVAKNLAQGCEYVKDCLGVDVPFGGVHSHMGTHNCLAKLGEDEFLEVIAINPDAEPPNRPRWFNIDLHGNQAPYLAHWVARTSNLANTLEHINAPVGPPMNCSRGNLNWQLTVPEDGSFAFDGMHPSLIDWPMRPFPGAAMADIGCQLQELSITHPQAAELSDALKDVLQDERVVIKNGEKPVLSAAIKTPSGLRTLS